MIKRLNNVYLSAFIGIVLMFISEGVEAQSYSYPAPSYPDLPSGFATHFDCTNGQCDNVLWADGYPSGTNTTQQTCVWAGDDSLTEIKVWVVRYSGGYSHVTYDNSGNTTRATMKVSADMPYTACYDGVTWTYYNNTDSISTGVKLERQNAAANWRSTLDVYAEDMLSNDTEMCCGAGYNTTVENTISTEYGVTAGVKIFDSNIVLQDFDLELQTFAPYTVGQEIIFEAMWTGLDFNPYYLYHFQDAEETSPSTIVEYYPMGDISGSGSWTYSVQYPTEGTYLPYAVIGNQYCDTVTSTGAITGSGCVILDAVTSNITVINNALLSESYDHVLTASKYSNVIVGETVNFNYVIDTDGVCIDSTITGRRLFMDHDNSPTFYLDSGQILSTNSGTGAIMFDRTNQPYSDFFYPHIHVYCADGSWNDIYISGTTVRAKAVPISVYTQDDFDKRQLYETTYLAGGEDEDLGDADTYSFYAEKHIYQPYEPVNIKYRFYPPVGVDIDTVRIYPDPDLIESFYTLDDSLSITEGNSHVYTYSYEEKGEYNPRITLVTATGGLIHFFLGGGKVVDSHEPIIVQGNVFNSTFFKTDRGIFGWGVSDVDIRICQGDPNCPWYLASVDIVVNPLIKSLVWIGSRVYWIVERMPVFSFVKEVIVPTEGLSYQVPTQVFGHNLNFHNSNMSYEIDYAGNSDVGALALLVVLKIVIGMYVFKHVLQHIF